MPHGDITHIDIPVADLTRAQEFYSGLFGWQIAAPPGFEDYPMWQAPNKISGGRFPIVTYSEAMVDDTLAKVEASGGTVLMAKSPITDTSWWAIFEDPDGNHIGLYEGITDTAGQ